MKKFGIMLIGAVILLLGFILFGPSRTIPNGKPATNLSKTMTITSSAFEHNGKIPKKYTCDGSPPAGGINPPLTISGVPEGAKSLVLIVDDPDAPNGTFVHWVLYGIGPNTKEIPEGIGGKIGFTGQTSRGKMEYGGPCPPSGAHRYFFKLYALDFEHFPLYETSPKKEEIEIDMQGHILDQTELIGIYER